MPQHGEPRKFTGALERGGRPRRPGPGRCWPRPACWPGRGRRRPRRAGRCWPSPRPHMTTGMSPSGRPPRRSSRWPTRARRPPASCRGPRRRGGVQDHRHHLQEPGAREEVHGHRAGQAGHVHHGHGHAHRGRPEARRHQAADALAGTGQELGQSSGQLFWAAGSPGTITFGRPGQPEPRSPSFSYGRPNRPRLTTNATNVYWASAEQGHIYEANPDERNYPAIVHGQTDAAGGRGARRSLPLLSGHGPEARCGKPASTTREGTPVTTAKTDPKGGSGVWTRHLFPGPARAMASPGAGPISEANLDGTGAQSSSSKAKQPDRGGGERQPPLLDRQR